ncbi:MAG: acetyl-CoA carboxylase, carboxyltransferase subunit beta [Thermoanaerobaculaceae bacterium]|jgi:acetyl-CoA carboxylase carboxyl transferase subunit beta|nr:acetyl-CoA carboxylase, carboxyltransferase subunit beta [Thermoanaerobaculaceae bacterium]
MWFRRSDRSRDSRIPEGLWVKCEGCKETLYHKELERTLHVCPRCGFHHRISARTRLGQLFDGSYKELFSKVLSTDPLEFVDTRPYKDRLKGLHEKGLKDDAVVVAFGRIAGIKAIVGAMEYAFMGGSMGSAVGEKLTRAAERCVKYRLPLVIVSCSGGARMQEGVLSLMQMAKISAALARLSKARLPYISVLTDPTTGGVTASYAMLGDVNIGEPGALIGFAGPRVIEQTIRQKLPEGFQRAEFLLEHGMLDMVVPRQELKETLARCLGHLQ